MGVDFFTWQANLKTPNRVNKFGMHFKSWKTKQVDTGGWGNQNFFVRMCPTGFQKLGLQNSFFLKKLGSWEHIFTKIGVFAAEILPKWEKNWP